MTDEQSYQNVDQPQNYVGVTVGPTMDTLSLISSPGGLWCASSILSWVTETLCREILDSVTDADIISPYFVKGTPAYEDGIGRYHDRIFFSSALSGSELQTKMQDITASVKSTMSTNIQNDIGATAGRIINAVADNKKKNCMLERFSKKHKAIETANEKSKKIDEAVQKTAEGTQNAFTAEYVESFINQYLQISYVIVPNNEAHKAAGNVILNISPYLDALELCQSFVSEQKANPLVKLFEGDAGDSSDKNTYVKNCFLIKRADISKVQLFKTEKQIKTIEEIAENNKDDGFKKRNYFAVVKADGDGVGNLLEKLTEDSDVKEFSKKLLEYTSAASELIRQYGGLTIYAGGDDLLFLAPLEGKLTAKQDADGGTTQDTKDSTGQVAETTASILDLCTMISEIFNKKLQFIYAKAASVPTVSFGVSVQTCKYPLYEALEEADHLLFEVAKTMPAKNCIAFKLQKGSGQTAELIIPVVHENDSENDAPEAGKQISNSPDYENNTQLSDLKKLIANMIKATGIKADKKQQAEKSQIGKVFNSVLYHLDLHENLICYCLYNKLDTSNLLQNIFDHSTQKAIKEYVGEISNYLENICNNYGPHIIPYCSEIPSEVLEMLKEQQKELQSEQQKEQLEKQRKEYLKALNCLKTLEHMLRLAKFYVEKEGAK